VIERTGAIGPYVWETYPTEEEAVQRVNELIRKPE